ncbi:hypothetical protein BCU94_07230 [Shewanella sp. 10N.286.52.C2]|uniref:hypothetical protein n=1 Tax=unclassified Shewanella TaxID=196818 RepID=UPI000C826C92|nr:MULTISPECIES: hypothetical protein [unclassified Shewanella]MDO6679910.1 hypothetical protein [Shewanella sp. 4_MG-2023]MDO6776877.1 hypothetical protein [Shewanella sp. 3_MG-2023]PMG31728.1 hypothetical protein BCU94_07230 [Shewanella sp. 10N.286.52.C2]
MPKSISVVILTFSLLATAQAVANPLQLFVQQCLQYKPSLASLDLKQTTPYQTLQFEQLTLGFNNFNDRLNYYRHLATHNQREGLLMCQLHLADELSALLTAPQLSSFIAELEDSHMPYSLLANKINAITLAQLDIDTKSQLHNAQATIRRNLSNSNLKLVFNNAQCQLDTNRDDTNSAFEISLAKYLLLQPDEQCRKTTWQAYQARAKSKNQQLLATIKTIKQQVSAPEPSIASAEAQSAPLQATQSLSTKPLLTNQLLLSFLESQTNNINTAPWNIGKTLSQIKNTPYLGPKNSSDLFQQVVDVLTPLGLEFEAIPLQVQADMSSTNETNTTASTGNGTATVNEPSEPITTYRLWHQQRLVGELYIHTSKHSMANIIRYPVIGQQFAQASVVFPKYLSNRRQAMQLVKSLSEAITAMTRGSQFYLVNKLGVSTDNYLLGYYWLSSHLQHQLAYLTPSAREQFAESYRQQLRVFRSKVAWYYLNSEQQGDDINNQQLNSAINQAFQASFNQQWPDAKNMAYSFNGIANEGLDYYHPLWQQNLVNLINTDTNASITNRQVFDILVVNEDNLSLIQQMSIILNPPTDPSSIIRRAFNVGNSKI